MTGQGFPVGNPSGMRAVISSAGRCVPSFHLPHGGRHPSCLFNATDVVPDGAGRVEMRPASSPALVWSSTARKCTFPLTCPALLASRTSPCVSSRILWPHPASSMKFPPQPREALKALVSMAEICVVPFAHTHSPPKTHTLHRKHTRTLCTFHAPQKAFMHTMHRKHACNHSRFTESKHANQ